ncbi:MAG TPA: DUF1552 domain-containing protein [Myxococcota bacterium]|nr:DUF1552 domain-containing protein [Myxococcota bacterium]
MARTLSRRTFLRGAGAAVALPFLDAMLPASARAQLQPSARRFLAWYVPNGMHMAAWTPSATGASYALTPILQPLAAVRGEVLVLSNLANRAGTDNAPGDHARGTGSFLTCTRVRRTEGADIQNGVSLDQLIAQEIGGHTILSSVQLGTEGGGPSGGCDSGYSCAYARNISWAGPASPLAKETNPQNAFDRLFQGADPQLSAAERERRRQLRLSILDAVHEDARRLRIALGVTDRRKLDEYLTGVRELELRLETTPGSTCTANEPEPPEDFRARVRAMADVMVLAFRCDVTRVITFMQANAGSNQTYPWLGVGDGHHQISHHQGNPANHAALQAIDTWEVEQFAYLLERLAAIPEPGGSVLDSSLVFFSSEIEDGDAHRHLNLPVLLAGRAGGAVQPGRHLRWSSEQKLADLFLTILRAYGIQRSSFGLDGTAPLSLA